MKITDEDILRVLSRPNIRENYTRFARLIEERLAYNRRWRRREVGKPLSLNELKEMELEFGILENKEEETNWRRDDEFLVGISYIYDPSQSKSRAVKGMEVFGRRKGSRSERRNRKMRELWRVSKDESMEFSSFYVVIAKSHKDCQTLKRLLSYVLLET